MNYKMFLSRDLL